MSIDTGKRYASTTTLLPPEVWDLVLTLCSPRDRQTTALALARALPASDASIIYLFAHVRITRNEKQALQLYQRLGPKKEDARELLAAIRTCSVACWRPDPDLVVKCALTSYLWQSTGGKAHSLIASMPSLIDISLLVGPLWSPDPVEDLLAKPYPSLRRLDLRFNPYVRKASYYTFLRGAYYDSALERIARWPALPSFTTLSFVQDPLPKLKLEDSDGLISDGKKSFAQPLVIFKTYCISSFAASEAAQSIRSLRLRIPNRSILTALTSPSTTTTVQPADMSAALLPSLRVLDISTTYVPLGPAFKSLLLRHTDLRHLILDRTGISGTEDFQALALTASSIGVSRAKEAHRAWRALLVRRRDLEALHAASQPQSTSTTSTSTPAAPRARRTGRSGLASEAAPAARRRQAAEAEAASSATISPSLVRYRSLPLAFYIIPSSPSLRSINCGSYVLDREERVEAAEVFEEAWQSGLERVEEMREEQLRAHRRPMTHGSLNGRKVLMRFAEPGEALPMIEKEDVWEELKRTWRMIETSEEEVSRLRSLSVEVPVCVLCTVAGCSGEGVVAWSEGDATEEVGRWRPARAEDHVEGCGHLVARRVFDEEME